MHTLQINFLQLNNFAKNHVHVMSLQWFTKQLICAPEIQPRNYLSLYPFVHYKSIWFEGIF